MFGRVISSTILGAAIVFLWGMFSWMYLPWHFQNMHQFKDEVAVTKTIQENVDASGIYILPFMPSNYLDASKEDKAKMMSDMQAKQVQGPNLFVSVSLQGMDPMMKNEMIQAGVLQLIGAFLITLLLTTVATRSYPCRVMFMWTLAVAIGILAAGPNYIWWKHDWNYQLVLFLDYVISWGIAGIFMAGIIKRKAA